MNDFKVNDMSNYFRSRKNCWFFGEFKLIGVSSSLYDDSIELEFLDKDNFKYTYIQNSKHFYSENIFVNALKLTLLERKMNNKNKARKRDINMNVTQYKSKTKNILKYLSQIDIARKYIIIDSGGVIAEGYNPKKVLLEWKNKELESIQAEYHDNQETDYAKVIKELKNFQFGYNNPNKQFHEIIEILKIVSDPVNDYKLRFIKI
ncbi:hypothetical protein [Staphylococcus gallinarum]|uniref:hypothetical protein n=1 Tax=Staphylococcus gallinarum TaxID=1293 RepID=UPI001E522FF6|nr:hypothetical protein [Staphylococcus gallinarum]MCD8845208.1 hypothetical protein [Staphylococcus gallinarum]